MTSAAGRVGGAAFVLVVITHTAHRSDRAELMDDTSTGIWDLCRLRAYEAVERDAVATFNSSEYGVHSL